MQSDVAKAAVQEKRREEQIQKLQETAREVYKLRNQAGQALTQAQALEKLRDENQQLRSAPASAAAASQTTKDENYVTKENWAFAGFNTPEATLQSVSWAMREGDPKSLLSTLTNDEKNAMQQKWGNKSEEEIRAENKHEIAEVTGYRILEKKIVSDTEVVLSVFAEGTGHLAKFSLKLTPNFEKGSAEWKFGGRAR